MRTMSAESRMPTQLVKRGDAHNSGESAGDGEENMRPRLLDRRLTSTDIDLRINAIVAPLST